MASLEGFDASEVDPNEGFSAIPAGDYDVIITASEWKPTKAGTGRYLELQLQVVSGAHINRKLFDRLNLENRNETAVKIARGTLSAICRAVNVITPKDSSELHHKSLTATVKVTKDNNGNPTNEVKGYKPRKTVASQTVDTQQAPVASSGSPF